MQGANRLVASLTVAALALGGLVLLPASAARAADEPLMPLPPRTGAGYVLGLSTAQIGSVSSAPNLDSGSRGGWGGVVSRNLVTVGTSHPTDPTGVYPAQSAKVSDPFVPVGGSQLRMSYRWLQLPQPDPNARKRSFSATNFGTTYSYLTCADSQWSQQSEHRKVQISQVASGNQGWTQTGGTLTSGPTPNGPTQTLHATGQSCPYLVGITLDFGLDPEPCKLNRAGCVDSPLPSGVTREGRILQWSAEAFAYQRYNYSPDSDEFALCQRQASSPTAPPSPECIWNPDYQEWASDMGDLLNGCGGAPQPEWLSFTWIVPMIQHWTRCLWVSPQGFDPTGRIDEAMSGGDMQVVVDSLAGANDSIHSAFIAGGCGTLLTGAPGIMSSFTIDTCEWDWATSARDFLGTALLFFVGLFAVRKTFDIVFESKTGSAFGKIVKD